MKLSTKIIIGIGVGCLFFVFSYFNIREFIKPIVIENNIQCGTQCPTSNLSEIPLGTGLSSLWKYSGGALFPNIATWNVGSAIVPIPNGYFTNLYGNGSHLTGIPATDLSSYSTTSQGDLRWLGIGATAANSSLLENHNAAYFQVAGSYQPLHANLTSLAGMATTVGLVKQTSANTFGIDATAYYKSGDTATFANITDSGLTSGRVVRAGAGGLLTDSGDLTFDPAKGLYSSINLGVGVAPSTYGAGAEYEAIANLGRTWTNATDGGYSRVGIATNMWWNPTGTGTITQYIIGGDFGINTTATEVINNSGYLCGINGYALHRANSTISTMYGLNFEVGAYNSGADTTGTITNLYGVRVIGLKTASSTITNAYGLYISGFSGSTALYDVYAADAAAKNYFAGSTGIGTATLHGKLTVLDSKAGNVELLTLKASYSTDLAQKSLTWRDATNITGQIDTRYAATGIMSMVFGHLYSGGYQTGDVMTLLGNGNVGIGIAVPTVPLHIKTANYATAFQHDDASYTLVTFGAYANHEGAVRLWYNGAEQTRLLANGSSFFGGLLGIGVTVPTAVLHLKAATAAANTASLKIDAGTVATTPVTGNIESDGTHLYWTDSGGTRRQLDN